MSHWDQGRQFKRNPLVVAKIYNVQVHWLSKYKTVTVILKFNSTFKTNNYSVFTTNENIYNITYWKKNI